MNAQPDALLQTLAGGPFDLPAGILRVALARGAHVRLPAEPIPSVELRGTYEVRRKHLAASGLQLPGFDLVAALFAASPERMWWLVGIDGAKEGGVLVLFEDQSPAGCFAYRD